MGSRRSSAAKVECVLSVPCQLVSARCDRIIEGRPQALARRPDLPAVPSPSPRVPDESRQGEDLGPPLTVAALPKYVLVCSSSHETVCW